MICEAASYCGLSHMHNTNTCIPYLFIYFLILLVYFIFEGGGVYLRIDSGKIFRNVLLVNSSADHLKVGDFGLSKLIRVKNSHDVYKMTGETGSCECYFIILAQIRWNFLYCFSVSCGFVVYV